MNLTDILLIGVDGGATEVKAHAVACDDLEKPSSFELRPEHGSRVYPRVSGFAPLLAAEQLAQRDAGQIKLTAKEVEQGRLYVQAAGEVIADVAQQCAAKRVLVGIGMPGLKTPDGRGTNTMNNGPRIPDYLDALEQNLTSAGLELVAPIAALGSDADYCGLGEEFAADGLFRDVENAYYVGCGTGIADALKLRGKLVPFDAAKSWIQKSWQMASALGPTFEKLISASSLNRVYADLTKETKRPFDKAQGRLRDEETKDECGTAVSAVGTGESTAQGAVAHEPRGFSPRGPRAARGTRRARRPDATGAAATVPRSAYPEVAAAAGDPVAIAWLDTAALVLAELIFERLWTIRNGRAEAAHRGEAYAKLNPDHDYRGTLLDRVIIGQRVGQIYGDARFRAVFGDKLDANLAALIAGSEDSEMREADLRRTTRPPRPAQLKPGFVLPSKLRAAPALGAGIAAVRALGATNV